MKLLEIYAKVDPDGSKLTLTEFEVTSKTENQFIPVTPKTFNLGYLKINKSSLSEVKVKHTPDGFFTVSVICHLSDKTDCLDKLVDIFNEDVRKAYQKHKDIMFIMASAVISGKV